MYTPYAYVLLHLDYEEFLLEVTDGYNEDNAYQPLAATAASVDLLR
jgi:hypothetical protein